MYSRCPTAFREATLLRGLCCQEAPLRGLLCFCWPSSAINLYSLPTCYAVSVEPAPLPLSFSSGFSRKVPVPLYGFSGFANGFRSWHAYPPRTLPTTHREKDAAATSLHANGPLPGCAKPIPLSLSVGSLQLQETDILQVLFCPHQRCNEGSEWPKSCHCKFLACRLGILSCSFAHQAMRRNPA